MLSSPAECLVSNHRGNHVAKKRLTYNLTGCDFVGKVVSRGEDSRRLQEGDRVAALVWGGTLGKTAIIVLSG